MNDKEKLYIEAKRKYYEGNPIMEDSAFDELEKQVNDDVKQIVGYFDRKAKFKHPSRMGSLSKIQANKETGEPPFEEFVNWCDDIYNTIKGPFTIEFSQKLDGNAINLVYINGTLSNALSRGDGEFGRDYISKINKSQLPLEIPIKNNTVEVRCEAVIKKETFNKKYAEYSSNERNYVAGILNLDEDKENAYMEIDLIPVEMHEIDDNNEIVYHDITDIEDWGFEHYTSLKLTKIHVNGIDSDYKNSFRISYEIYESFKHNISPYRIDGFVAKINADFRKIVGETKHHPKWAIAIKFKPENASTEVVGMELNMGKTGYFTPVILLKPVELDGSVVSRVSGYNYRYVKENFIGQGAIVTMVKSGDIIPQIISIDYKANNAFDFPEKCPYCNTNLEILNNTHIICPNNECNGKKMYKFINSFNSLELDGVGDAFIEMIYNKCDQDPLYYVNNLKNLNKSYFIEHGIKDGKILENFISKLKNINEIKIEKILSFMSIDGISIGGKTTTEIANKLSNIPYSFNGLEKRVVDGWDEGQDKFKRFLIIKNAFEKNGVKIIYNENKEGFIKLCLTGSPKKFGFNDKKDYIKKLINDGVKCVETTVIDCDYLVTDDLSKTSTKMKQALKLNKNIVEYNFNFK